MWLRAENIIVNYGENSVIRDLSFSVDEKQTLAVLGKSGCGKTTLLKVISGLLRQTSGQIFLRDKSLDATPANKRNIIYLNQEALLFPHLNVFENIAFGLRVKKQSQDLIRNAVTEMLANLGLEGYDNKMPTELSGGQRQRVSFGRALILNPSVLLLDEPFGSLDAQTRTRMQRFYKEISQEYAITSVFVTHDVKEAMLMGDEIALMDKGQLEEFETKEAFIEDERTGARQEMDFWNQIQSGVDKK